MRHLVLAFVLAATPALARPLDGPPDAGRRIAHLTDQLGLDDAQAVRVQDIVEAAHAEGEAVHAAHRQALDDLRDARLADDEAGMRAALDAVADARADAEAHRKATHDAIVAELTLAQQADFVLAHVERRERRGEVLEKVGGRIRAEGERLRGDRRSDDELTGL